MDMPRKQGNDRHFTDYRLVRSHKFPLQPIEMCHMPGIRVQPHSSHMSPHSAVRAINNKERRHRQFFKRWTSSPPSRSPTARRRPLAVKHMLLFAPAEVYNLGVRQVMLFVSPVQAHSVDRKLCCWKKLEAIQVIQESCEIHRLRLE